MKKGKGNLLGSWAFLIGFILAVVLSIFQTTGLNPVMTYVLVLIGILVGLLNIGDEEVHPFLISGVVLVIVGILGQSVVQVIPVFDRILQALTLLFVPATIIVALKNVFSLSRN
jgi:hypothetical protein